MSRREGPFKTSFLKGRDQAVCRSVVVYALPSTILRRTLNLAALCLSLMPGAWAQKDTGSIVGTVIDPSGAVVPRAKLIVTDIDRGTTFVTSTGENGVYVASALKIGHYSVAVEVQGFKKAVAGPIEVQVQRRVAVDMRLELGSPNERVQVTGTPPLLESETSELGQVIDSNRITNLPLNGRNFAQLATLSAGVVPAEPGASNESSFGFSSNGGRSYQNNYQLDGVDNNSNLVDLQNGASYVSEPSVDALEEFKVETNAYSAEFGRSNGAVLNAATKSGNNAFHGDVYEFLRNDRFDARNFFERERSSYKQNQFGFTLGGPVRILHIYNGRNRTFFFVDGEGLRIRQGNILNGFVPTAQQRTGNFQNLIDFTSPVTDPASSSPIVDCNGVQTYAGEIFNTRLTQQSSTSPTGLCGVPFGYDANGNPLNRIPTQIIDPLAVRLAQLLPLPNIAGSGFNFVTTPSEKLNRNNFDVRVDHWLSANDNAFSRVSYAKEPRVIPAIFQATGGDGADSATGHHENVSLSAVVSETHIFNPRWLNEFRLGYNRIDSKRVPFRANQNVSAEVGFPGVPFVPSIGGLPRLDFSTSGLTSFGSPDSLPSHEIQNTGSFSENLTWGQSKHILKLGGEIRSEEFTIFQPAFPRGQLSFGPVFTDNPAAPGSGGSDFASFLAGLAEGGTITSLHNVDYKRPVFAFFAQDDLKLTPKLTLNLGLRYELFTTIKERFDAQASYDIATQTLFVPRGQEARLTPTLAALIPISRTASRGLVPVDADNFSPRVGLAFRAMDLLVIRAGYGVFYDGYETGPWANPSPGFNPPFFSTQVFNPPCPASSANLAPGQLDCSVPGLRYLKNGFPSSALSDPSTPLLSQISRNVKTPYVHQWHVSMQYQLPEETLLEISYAGSKGADLYAAFNGNQAAPTADSTIPFAVRRPVPKIDAAINVLSTIGSSSYNSLQVRAEKRMGRGLTFLAAYTWGHSLDTTSFANLGSDASASSGDRWFAVHPNWERANSDFDIRHRFVLSYIYELPLGRGKRFLEKLSGPANLVLGGWQLSGIATFSTGNWYTIGDGNGNFSNSDGGQRPDQVGNPNRKPCVPGTYFNTCAFADPPPGSFGNADRNTVRGPGLQNWDFAVLKEFPMPETTRLEFRAEFFNLFNHTNLIPGAGDSQSLGSNTFGFATAARPPRLIQFALKFYF